jgi:predicted PurR-regulated permease PerM
VNDSAESSQSAISVKNVLKICLTVLGVATAVYILTQTRLSVTLTIAAAVVAIALNHLVDALGRVGVKRPAAIAVVVVGVLVVFGGINLLVFPPAIDQGRALIKQAPQLIAKMRQTYFYETLNGRFHLDERFADVLQLGAGKLPAAVEPALKAISSALGTFASVVTVFVLNIFMLAFGGRIVQALLAEATPEHRERYQRILKKIYDSIGGYIAGLLLIAFVNACCATVFLAINGVPFFLPLGIISGLLSLIPYVGPPTMAILTGVISLVTGGVWHAVAAAIYFIFYGAFEGQVLAPMVYRRTVNVNPLVAILSVLFFVDLFGTLGAVIAVPAVATGQILLRELLAGRRERLGLASSEDRSPGPEASLTERARRQAPTAQEVSRQRPP